MEQSLKEIGNKCRCFRREQGITQNKVAEDTGYSCENISSFENGRNDNSRILLWYMLHGMTIEYLLGV